MNLIENPRAHFDYQILEEFEAGIVLFGHEARSIREKRGSLKGAHVLIRGGEAFVVNMSIPAWQLANAPKDYDPERPRKLLLSKRQIMELGSAENQNGLAIIPVSVYSKGRRYKMRVAIARGKKKQDKRQDIKKRDDLRSADRSLKHRF